MPALAVCDVVCGAQAAGSDGGGMLLSAIGSGVSPTSERTGAENTRHDWTEGQQGVGVDRLRWNPTQSVEGGHEQDPRSIQARKAVCFLCGRQLFLACQIRRSERRVSHSSTEADGADVLATLLPGRPPRCQSTRHGEAGIGLAARRRDRRLACRAIASAAARLSSAIQESRSCPRSPAQPDRRPDPPAWVTLSISRRMARGS